MRGIPVLAPGPACYGVDDDNPVVCREDQYTPEVGIDRAASIKGIVIAKKNKGLDSSFRIMNAIEEDVYTAQYPYISPLLKGVKIQGKSHLHEGKKRTRRAKLYYLLVRALPWFHCAFDLPFHCRGIGGVEAATWSSSVCRRGFSCDVVVLAVLFALYVLYLQDKPPVEYEVLTSQEDKERRLADRLAKRLERKKKRKVVKKK